MRPANKFVIRLEEDKARATTWINNLDMSMGPWEVQVTRHRKTKSNAQNRYLWGVLYSAIVQETGHKADDIHEFLLMECFGTEEYEVLGMRRLRPVRTTTTPKKMTTDEIDAYMEWCRAYAASKLGLYIPEPNEVAY